MEIKKLLFIILAVLMCSTLYSSHTKINIYSNYIILNGDSIKFNATADNQIIARIGGKWTNWTPNYATLYEIDSVWFKNEKLYIRQGNFVDSTTTISTFTTADEIDQIYSADSAYIKTAIRNVRDSIENTYTKQAMDSLLGLKGDTSDVVYNRDTIPPNGIATKSYIKNNFMNSFVNTIPVTKKIINVTWPKEFNNTTYHLSINAWYTENVRGKNIRINNAIYDYTKSTTGFQLTVDTIAGYLDYIAVDTISLYPLIFTRGYSQLSGTTVSIESGYDGDITLTGHTTITINDPDNGEYGDILVTQGSSDYTLTITPTPKVINSGAGVVGISSGAGTITIVSYKVLNNTIYVNYGQDYD